MNRQGRPSCLWALVPALILLGCAKDAAVEPPPPVSDYRAYDHVPVAVKDAGEDGFMVLCKNTPIGTRAGYLQRIGANGEEGGSIRFDALSTRIEDVEFDPEEIRYTDFIRLADGSWFIAGTARQTDLEDRLHLIGQHVTSGGVPIDAPFRRYLASNTVLGSFDDADLLRDLAGWPRERALCELLGAQRIVVAVRWETVVAAGVRLFGFPVSGGGATLRLDVPLDGPTHRLHCLKVGPDGHVAIVVDGGAEPGGHTLKVLGFRIGGSGWVEDGSSELPFTGAEPQRLIADDQGFALLGYAPVSGGGVGPFVSRFGSAGAAGAATRMLQLSGAGSDPVTAYCGSLQGGTMSLMLQRHETGALPPYFAGDITSDLVIADDGGVSDAVEGRIIIPGQGLRAMGLFAKDGQRIVIGSQHPYLNAGYQHTFLLVLR